MQTAHYRKQPFQKKFSATEVIPFIKHIIIRKKLVNSAQKTLFNFPNKIILNFTQNEFQLFFGLEILSMELGFGLEGKLALNNNSHLMITPTAAHIGKLKIPGFVCQYILKILNIIIAYPVPSYIKDITISNENLYLTTNATFANYSEQIKAAIKPKITKPAAPLNTKELPKPKPSYDKKAAKKLHNIGNYFFARRHYDMALKYYQKVLNLYPEYDKKDEIIKQIEMCGAENPVE